MKLKIVLCGLVILFGSLIGCQQTEKITTKIDTLKSTTVKYDTVVINKKDTVVVVNNDTIYVSPNTNGFVHYLGELYGGGIVVSVWKQGGVEHGLIASLTDLSNGIIWTTPTYQTTMVPGGSISPIDGLANSNAIVAQAGAGTSYAAGLCRAYSAAGDGGLNDWYLPSSVELGQCYNATLAVNAVLGSTNGFQFGNYWSSTELNAGYIWYLYFYDDGLTYASKANSNRVRAVRRF